jgi:hypothetical protein
MKGIILCGILFNKYSKNISLFKNEGGPYGTFIFSRLGYPDPINIVPCVCSGNISANFKAIMQLVEVAKKIVVSIFRLSNMVLYAGH